MNSITLLGTGTCQIQKHRMAPSVLIELETIRVLYDIGRGITQRMHETGLKNDDIEHIVFSHFHPDHWGDLITFLHAASWSRIDPRTKDLNIYGPKGTKEKFEKITNVFEGKELLKGTYNIHIQEITQEEFKIDNQIFQFIELPPDNNHGLKFIYKNKTYAITGDSFFHGQEVSFLKGVDLAVVDAGHISPDELIELAVQTQTKTTICSHIYDELEESVLNKQAQGKGYKGNIIVGEDLMKLDLGNN